MAPSLVVLMRHAEKPSDPKDPNLSTAGFERAQNLVHYIPQEFGAIDFLFTNAISKHSSRPYETLEPLSKKIGIPIDATYADQDYEPLVSDLLSDSRYAGKRAIVAWHHGFLPSFAKALGASQGTYPDPWNPAIFDLLLKFAWKDSGGLDVTEIREPF